MSVLPAADQPGRAHLPAGQRLPAAPLLIETDLNSSARSNRDESDPDDADAIGSDPDEPGADAALHRADSRDAHPALTTAIPEDGGEIEITGRLLQASNATFLADLHCDAGTITCVYKPIEGERPLWDFPQRTLGLREVAAYEISRAGGFDVVPVTVLADGPLGLGSLQVWVEEDPVETGRLVDLVPRKKVPKTGWFTCVEGFGSDDQPVAVVHADRPDLRMLAVFDVLVNNADRKGGHILGSAGRIFGVDHGVTFHTDNKLRTLLWGWAGSTLLPEELLRISLARDQAPEVLRTLVSQLEIDAFVRRADLLLERKRLPRPHGSWPSIPWPPF